MHHVIEHIGGVLYRPLTGVAPAEVAIRFPHPAPRERPHQSIGANFLLHHEAPPAHTPGVPCRFGPQEPHRSKMG